MYSKLIPLVCFLNLHVQNHSFCQNTIAQSNLKNFSKKEYNAGLQNWDIKIDNNSVSYFANNEGMLTYDGKNWKLFPIPNQTIVRSILLSKNNKIYVGGQDEIGYFQINSSGTPTFKSLYSIIPKQYQKFADVWDIIEYESKIFFRTRLYIFVLENEKIQILPAQSEWVFMQATDELLFAQDRKKGIFQLKNSFWTNSTVELPFASQITGFHKIVTSKYLITTLSDGLWFFDNGKIKSHLGELNTKLKNARIYKSYKIDNNKIALATSSEGVFILDFKANLVQNISEKDGMLDNNVLSITTDLAGNIWTGLNSGISQIVLSSAVKLIKPMSKNASVYSAVVHQNKLYIATSSGLYYSQLQPKPDLSNSLQAFKLIPKSEGQNWNLNLINGRLFLGHHEGAFEVKEGQLKSINHKTGFWKYVLNSKSNQILAGTYQGIEAINTVKPEIFLEKFKESSRFLESDEQGNIWVSHPYHGVFKIDRNKKINTYNSKNGLPYDTDNYIFKIKNKIIAATKNGIYLFDYQANRFIPDTSFTETLNKLSIRYIKEDSEGNIWFIHKKSVGVLDFSAQKPIIYNIPELQNLLVNGFENIYSFNKNNIFIGGESGLFHINYENYVKNRPKIEVSFSQVKATSAVDSILYGGFGSDAFENSKAIHPKIPFNFRNIYFDYTSNQNPNNIEFAYQLVGIASNWSVWTNKKENYYTNLSEGQYQFLIKARNNFGDESAPISYHFSIDPPWYRSIFSYIIYSLVLLYCLFRLRKWQKNKFSAQKKRFENEQIRLKENHEFELSKTELDFKNLALSNSALRLLHKAEILSNVKNEIDQIITATPEPTEYSAQLKKLLRTLENEVKDKHEWQSFSQSFDMVHGDFISRLKKRYPQLSANDLKTCAMIKMNLSSKEMAQILNITLKGVELSRYRLRKKLKLNSNVNLFDFLLQI